MSDRIIVATMALAGCLMMAPPAEAALLGYWKFDEDSGTVANDSGPNGLDGTVVFGEGGGWETTDAKSGNSLRFTGRNENVVNLPSVFPDLGDADPFTISAWVKETRSEGTQTLMPVIFYQAPGDSFTPNVQILRDRRGGGNDRLAFGLRHANPERADQDGSIGQQSGSGDPLAWDDDGLWHHVVLGRDATTVYLYTDNAVGISDARLDVHPEMGGLPAAIGNGAYVGGTTLGWDGLIDDVQIYDEWVGESGVDFLFNNPGVVVPEPSALALLLGSLILIPVLRRRRRG